MPLLSDIIELLKQDGWVVNPEKTTQLIGERLRTSNTSLKDVVGLLFNEDIRDFGHPALQDHLDKKNSMFTGPLVVQLARWKSVSYPKIAEHLKNDGLCKLSLTDGFSTLEGLQVDQPLDPICGNTPAGTKILLRGKITYEGGYLILDPSNCCFLGGHVEKLVEKWMAAKLSIKKDGNTIATDYPKFEPFQKKKIDYKSNIEANLSSLTINSTGQNAEGEASHTPKDKNATKKKAAKPIRSENPPKLQNHDQSAPQHNHYANTGQTGSATDNKNQLPSHSRPSYEGRQGNHANIPNTQHRGGRGSNKPSNFANRSSGRQTFNSGTTSTARYDHPPSNKQERYGPNFGSNSVRNDRQFGNNAGRTHASSNAHFPNRPNQRPVTMPAYNSNSQEEFPVLGGQGMPPSVPAYTASSKMFYRSKRPE